MNLPEILRLHDLWLAGNSSGAKADLSKADLSEADLRGADLRGADLRGADLREANLSGSNLRGSNLSGSNLSGSNLRGSNLSGSNLSGSNLSGSNLSGADLPVGIPIIPDIDRAILAAIHREGCKLQMDGWHTCETTHCRAGWAITLAGDAGRALEAQVGPAVAGTLIYTASRPARQHPDFYASDEDAMASIIADAEIGGAA